MNSNRYKLLEIECVECGALFHPCHNSRKQYCSHPCYLRSWIRRGNKLTPCLYCKKEFTQKKSQVRKYCTKKCFDDIRRGIPYRPLEERFFEKVKKGNECWTWMASKNNKGYGKLDQRYAHRISWEIHNGKIGEGLEVCHSCDNPICVNPRHLWLGTHKENMRDSVKKGRMFIPGLKGEDHGRAKISENDVLNIRKLWPSKTQVQIGAIYGISHGAVSNIVKRKTWANV